MPALIIPFLVEHLRLPSWLIKVIMAIIAICLVIIAMAICTWQLRTYAEHETQVAVTQATNAAKADVAAKVDAASEKVVREQHEAEVRGMAQLARDQVENAEMWSAIERTLGTIPADTTEPSHSDAPAPVPFAPTILTPLPPVGPFLPEGRRGSAVPPATSVRRSLQGLDGFVAADRAADRLLERTTNP